MYSWRAGGRDDERIEDIVRSLVLNAYVQGAKDMLIRASGVLP